VIQATEEMAIALATRGLSGLLEVIDRDYVKRYVKAYVRLPREFVSTSDGLEYAKGRAKGMAAQMNGELVSESFEVVEPQDGDMAAFATDTVYLVFQVRRND
jgi:hypothetical protein